MKMFSSESLELAIMYFGILMGDDIEPNFIRMLPSRTKPACLRVTSSILKDESKTVFMPVSEIQKYSRT